MHIIHSPRCGKSYISKRLNEIAIEYDVSIKDVVNLYNCRIDGDRLGEWLIVENLNKNKSLDEINKIVEEIKTTPF